MPLPGLPPWPFTRRTQEARRALLAGSRLGSTVSSPLRSPLGVSSAGSREQARSPQALCICSPSAWRCSTQAYNKPPFHPLSLLTSHRPGRLSLSLFRTAASPQPPRSLSLLSPPQHGHFLQSQTRLLPDSQIWKVNVDRVLPAPAAAPGTSHITNAL